MQCCVKTANKQTQKSTSLLFHSLEVTYHLLAYWRGTTCSGGGGGGGELTDSAQSPAKSDKGVGSLLPREKRPCSPGPMVCSTVLSGLQYLFFSCINILLRLLYVKRTWVP